MSKIIRQDTNGVKPLLAVGELGYDNYPTGGDAGRVYVGNGSINIPQAKKSEVIAVDGKIDTHVVRVDNPHAVTKAQVGLGNVDNTSDSSKNVLSASKLTTARTITLTGDVTGSVSFDGTANASITATIASNSVALGIDTTGNYVADATAGNGIVITGTVGEGWNPTISLTDVGVAGTYKSVTVDAQGRVAAGTNPTTISGYGITDAYTKAELNAGQLDNRYYTETEVNAALALKVDDTEIASVNLLRADKYLAAQNIANMSYTDGNLTKIQYNDALDIDYEVFAYTSGNLSSIQHYVGSVLKGTTTLSYTSGNLVSAIFVGV